MSIDILQGALAAFNGCLFVMVYRLMIEVRRDRSTLEKALAEAYEMRRIARKAVDTLPDAAMSSQAEDFAKKAEAYRRKNPW